MHVVDVVRRVLTTAALTGEERDERKIRRLKELAEVIRGRAEASTAELELPTEAEMACVLQGSHS